jgi:hypothetical protein
MGSPEWEAAWQAGQLLAQDRARETLRRQDAEPVTAQWDMAADEKRGQALRLAYEARGAVRMGPDVPASAVVLPNGALAAVHWKKDTDLIQDMSPGVLTQTLIRPEQWEQHNREWQARRRLDDNLVLAQYWGRDLCLAEGWITAEEAAELPPGPPPNPAGPPYSILRSVG